MLLTGIFNSVNVKNDDVFSLDELMVSVLALCVCVVCCVVCWRCVLALCVGVGCLRCLPAFVCYTDYFTAIYMTW